ncbi:hypothetical protein F0U60_00290 [Archangium minus]|uniref:Uncharacterized protein n=1 Tax=Archangium minus TaxID=83450 RepID=A0ABY9WHE4_9BACT|nr:hypothetical protein F0U60_00290 [Archangium minus]
MHKDSSPALPMGSSETSRQLVFLVLVLLGCLSLIPLAAHAQEHEEVKIYILSARRLYEDLEFEHALEQISRAKHFSRTKAEDVLLSLYEGVILADLSKADESSAAFKAALFLQPDAKLPLKVAPKVEKAFESVRQQVQREMAKQAVRNPGAHTQVPAADHSPVKVKPQDLSVNQPLAELQPEPSTVSASQRLQATEAAPPSFVKEVAQARRDPALTQAQPPVSERPPAEVPPQDVPTRMPLAARVQLASPVASVSPPHPTTEAVPQAQAPSSTEASPTSVTKVARSGGMRSRAWLPAALGGVLLAGGGGFYALARNEQSKLRGDDSSLVTLQDVERSASRGSTYQAVGMGLAGAGVVGLGLATGMYLLGEPAEPQKVELGLSTNGTSAFVYGRWP